MMPHIPRNLILAAAASMGAAAVAMPSTASAGCYDDEDARAAGTVLGAVIGGGIGSSLAHGHSRGAGTVAGALLGGAIGNSAAGSRCYHRDRDYAYYDDGYAYDGDYDPYYSRTEVYVEPRPYVYHYYTPGYRYYERHYYRPYWHHHGW